MSDKIEPSPLSPTRQPLLQEKELQTPATTISSDSVPPTPTSQNAPRGGMEGALGSLLWGAFGPCIPVVIVTSVLLTAILYNQIDKRFVFIPGDHNSSTNQASSALDGLEGIQRLENGGGEKAYYLYYNSITNPAVLHMIASWTAKILPFVTGASMAVVAFFAGRQIIDATKKKSQKLPSPHQVSILVGLLNGGGSQPLLDTVMYRWNRHTHLVQPVSMAFWCLIFIVVMIFVIGAIDSWFGTATTALNIALVVPTANISKAFGRNLDSYCVSETWHQHSCPSNTLATCRYPCSITAWINPLGEEREGVSFAQQAAQTLMYNSPNNTILNATVDGSRYFFLGDLHSGTNLDFRATTVAIRTQCQMVTQVCSVGHGFTCGSYNVSSFSYSGAVGFAQEDVTSPSDEAMVGIQFFNDTVWNQPVGFENQTTDLFSAQNPLYFLAWSKGFPPMQIYDDQFRHMRDGKYYKHDDTGDTVFILNCSTSIYNAEYYWVNGTVAFIEPEALEDTPGYYGAVFSAPFAINSALSHLALQDAAALAAYEKTPENLTNVYSNYFSRAAIALTSGFSVAVPNQHEATRNNNYLATRVPYMPLYTLIALKAVYAIFAVSLAVLAAFCTHPSQAQEIKERLTVDGLATGFFEPWQNHVSPVKNVKDLFSEHGSPKPSGDPKKIGLLQQTTNGGWFWVTLAQRPTEGLGIQEFSDEAANRSSNAVGRRLDTLKSLVGKGFCLVKETL